MAIAFTDLAIQYQKLKREIDANIQQVLDHGKFIMGPEISELESRLAAYIGIKHCITCSNGTDALVMPLMAWGIGEGDAVFTTTFSFIATSEVISLLNATPVFVDIDPNTFNIDPAKLDAAIQKTLTQGKLKPAAIITVDLFGLPAEYNPISQIADKYGLKLLEDAAQGFGGIYNGKQAGSFGDAAATSFFPSKPLGCYGDGGAIFTNNDDLAEILKSIRVHGKGTDKYDNIRVGLNARLDTIQAAILLSKLTAFETYEFDSRNRIAAQYTEALSGLITTPFVPRGMQSSWAQYSICASNPAQRNLLQRELKNNGIPTMIYYNKPLHLQSVSENLGYKAGDLPIAEDISSRIFSLPMHPYIEPETIAMIAKIIATAV